MQLNRFAVGVTYGPTEQKCGFFSHFVFASEGRRGVDALAEWAKGPTRKYRRRAGPLLPRGRHSLCEKQNAYVF
jgi:hypothetical protein